MAEGDFKKIDGDILYGTEANSQTGHFQLVEAGEGLTAGNVIYVHLTDGKAYQSGTATADVRASGIAVNTVSSGADVTMQTGGKYKTTGLTDKADYYLAASGAISTTLSGVRIGTALSTTELWIHIIQDDRDAIGVIKPYLKSFTNIPANNLTAFWVECNGQTLSDTESILTGQVIPNLNGSSGTQRFLRGSTTSGTESVMSVSGTTSTVGASSGDGGSGNHSHSFSGNITKGDYHEVVFIMKVK